MQSESVDYGNQRVRLAAAASAAAADTRGKHRISAELKRLEQEARLLESPEFPAERKDSGNCLQWEIFDSYLGRKSWNNLKKWRRPQLRARKQMARQVLTGIGGLKDPKIHRVADAGSCDGC
ncbi:hypothetical protein HYC85_003381 [Camellia sinensis]|uniref:Uncharacterized protein n=1 Tax=Camellia sinensis TaxID=4442 RepID=A0A7J7IB65_CAMSI|nr:hypothetical protein HYC85_003381 [Camellia sinensis]